MSDDTADSPDSHPGSRLAKVIARAGLASRRDAEGMIEALRVTVNGRTVSTPAYNVEPGDRIAVDGVPLPEAEGARVWLYHKPAGLVTTERDEKDRETVFDALRAELGRVMSIGRLDLTSEGLLLLTNDGDLKRRLELPETGWLRRYRVRVNGSPTETSLQPLRDGIEVDGEAFAPMQVTLDRQQGANAWLTMGLREGRNREIRRAMEVVGLYVNRLIRISYGPFQLGNLGPGEVEEVKPRVLRDQIGTLWDGDLAEGRREAEASGPAGKPAPQVGRKPRSAGDRLVDHGRGAKRGASEARGAKAVERRDGAAADRAARPERPRTGKPPVTRNDRRSEGPAGIWRVRPARQTRQRAAEGPINGHRYPPGTRPGRRSGPFRQAAGGVGARGTRPGGSDRSGPGGAAGRSDSGGRADRIARTAPGSREDGPRGGKPFAGRTFAAKPAGGRTTAAPGDRRRDEDASRRPKHRNERPGGDRPGNDRFAKDRPGKDRPSQSGPGANRPGSTSPGSRSFGGKPAGDRRSAAGKAASGAGDGPRDRVARGAPAGDRPERSRAEKKAAMRADTSVSLRKGGQRGRGIVKAKKAPGKTFSRPAKPKDDDSV